MRRGPFFALDRVELRRLIREIGGDATGLLVLLAAEAKTDSGRVHGNLRDFAELVGRSPKHLRVALPRLEEHGLVEWRRGRGPGDGGEGWVDVLCYDRLDGRGRNPRTAPDPAGVPVSTTAPDRVGVEDEPRPNRAPTAPPLRPNGHELPGETTPRQKTEDRRLCTHPPETFTRGELAEAAGHQYAHDEVNRGSQVRSPSGLARSKTRELLTKHADRLDSLIDRDASRRAAGADPIPGSVMRAAALGDTHSLVYYPMPTEEVTA